jgi:hypothetical protein
MPTNLSSRVWTLAEDQLLQDLLNNNNVSNDLRARYPSLSWRHIAYCMNELSSTRDIAMLRPYDAAEVESRYLDHLRGDMDVVRDMMPEGEDGRRAGKDMEIVKESETSEKGKPGEGRKSGEEGKSGGGGKPGEEGKSIRRVEDSCATEDVICLD